MSELLTALAASPWLYLVVVVVAALDALLPFMPSETTVIAVGVMAASGQPDVAAVVVLAALGAFLGDNGAYLVGRYASARPLAWLLRRRRWRSRYDWAQRTMRERGPLLIIVGRYLPAGRVTTMVAAGALRYPLGRFQVLDAVATTVWSAWATLIGYFGGAAFGHDPFKGLVAAFALATVVAIAVEGVRRLVTRRPPRSAARRGHPRRRVPATHHRDQREVESPVAGPYE